MVRLIAADCVAQRHEVNVDRSKPYRACPDYCTCWCHYNGELVDLDQADFTETPNARFMEDK